MEHLRKYDSLGRKKVAIIGVGYVGASIAYALTIRGLAGEIVLIDMDQEKTRGEAADIQHGIPFMGVSAVRAGDYSDCADCDMIIITAGRNRRPGETRLNLVWDNSVIMRSVIDQLKPYYNRGVILIVSNPVDLMVSLCANWMRLPDGMVFGTGCLLDTSRMVRVISDYVGLNPEVVQGIIAGEHGDGQVPIWSRLTIGGIAMAEYCASVGLQWTSHEQAQMADKVKQMGAYIIKRKSRTHYGIATCVCSLADAVLNNRPTIVPVSSPLHGEYGVNGVALSVPSIVGKYGVERRIVETWSSEELLAFQNSAKQVKDLLAYCESNESAPPSK